MARPRRFKDPVEAPAGVPDFLPFQHPRLVETPPDGPDWLHEPKYDGYRMQVRVAGGAVAWRTRERHDWSERFSDLSAALAGLGDAILDGELCVLDEDGHSSFSALRSAVGRRQAGRLEGALSFMVFDILWSGAEDLRTAPLQARRERLEALLAPALGLAIRLAPSLPGGGARLLEAACRLQLEGVVSKRLGAPYTGGEARPDSWRKAKCRPSGEFVIGGWRSQNGRFRSLLAGVMEAGRLRYVGRVHSGYGAEKMDVLAPRLRALEAPRSPFATGDPPRSGPDIHWVRPELVARVTFAEFTASGKLRQAAYQGLREDKLAAHVVAERPDLPAPTRPERRRPSAAGPVEISHPQKVLWPAAEGRPAVTKADLAAYYARCARWMSPYLAGRPCTLVMAPDGVDGPVTWVRHEGHWQGPLRTSSRISHIVVQEKEARTYPTFDTVEALMEAAELAVVEFHPWNSAPGEPMRPGRLLFDVDPSEATTDEALATAALELRERLGSAGLEAFVKTSGKAGLHVVTPLAADPPASWSAARDFASALCAAMAADSPGAYTTALPKAQRRGRLFLDYLRNDPGRHAAGLLSPRTLPGAPVSMPLSWRQLEGGDWRRPVSLLDAPEAMAAQNPWEGLDQAARPLPKRAAL